MIFLVLHGSITLFCKKQASSNNCLFFVHRKTIFFNITFFNQFSAIVWSHAQNYRHFSSQWPAGIASLIWWTSLRCWAQGRTHSFYSLYMVSAIDWGLVWITEPLRTVKRGRRNSLARSRWRYFAQRAACRSCWPNQLCKKILAGASRTLPFQRNRKRDIELYPL